VALALVLSPTLQIQTATAVADTPLAVFFALAGVAGWRWVEEGDRRQLWLGGLFAAAAVGCKVEGRVFVAFLAVAVTVAAARHGRSLRELGLVAAAVAASALPWVLWTRLHEIGDVFSAAGGLSPGGLGRIPSAAASMVRELADPSSWLALVALAAAATVLALTRPAGREAGLYTLFVAGASLAAMVGVYWVTPLDFDYHVATSVRRVITAPVVFAAAMTPLLLSRQTAR
jgi:4-amino-4-deoxy-L-arabinose transferase-like glycosyltransferase